MILESPLYLIQDTHGQRIQKSKLLGYWTK